MVTHDGLPSYTIGQRKGLGISGAGEPLYVLELDRTRNALIVGPQSELGQSTLHVHNVNWTLDAPVARRSHGRVQDSLPRDRGRLSPVSAARRHSPRRVRISPARRRTRSRRCVLRRGPLPGRWHHRAMIALVPPGVLVGLAVCALYAGLFHVWGGRTVRDLIAFWIAAVVGFTVGQADRRAPGLAFAPRRSGAYHGGVPICMAGHDRGAGTSLRPVASRGRRTVAEARLCGERRAPRRPSCMRIDYASAGGRSADR